MGSYPGPNQCAHCATQLPQGALACPQCMQPQPSPYITEPAPISPAVLGYRSSRGLSVAAMVLLGVSVFVTLISFGLEWRAHGLLGRLATVGDVEQGTLNSIDLQLGFIGLGEIGLVIGTATVFLSWVYRAHKNLDSLHAGSLEFTHGWAVGSFFVPIVNLFRPKKVMDEIWHGSGTVGSAGIIPLWWGCWVFSGIITRASTVSSRTSTDPSAIANGFMMMMAADVLVVVAGIAAIQMVRSIQAAQDAKAATLTSRSY